MGVVDYEKCLHCGTRDNLSKNGCTVASIGFISILVAYTFCV